MNLADATERLGAEVVLVSCPMEQLALLGLVRLWQQEYLVARPRQE